MAEKMPLAEGLDNIMAEFHAISDKFNKEYAALLDKHGVTSDDVQAYAMYLDRPIKIAYHFHIDEKRMKAAICKVAETIQS